MKVNDNLQTLWKLLQQYLVLPEKMVATCALQTSVREK